MAFLVASFELFRVEFSKTTSTFILTKCENIFKFGAPVVITSSKVIIAKCNVILDQSEFKNNNNNNNNNKKI